MSTLLLRLAAPLQSWGLEDKFERRGTAREPTKSGVTGLLAAAMGIARDNDSALEKLRDLRYGVRIDQPGQILSDFHTARVEGKANPYVTRRFYLADAAFVAGLESEDEAYLYELEQALLSPVYPLFLGRRSCPPEGKLSLGVCPQPLEDALRNAPWQAGEPYRRRKESAALTLVLDTDRPSMLRRRDTPLSFSQLHRKHAFRFVDDIHGAVMVRAENAIIPAETQHDAFAELEAQDVSFKN